MFRDRQALQELQQVVVLVVDDAVCGKQSCEPQLKREVWTSGSDEERCNEYPNTRI